MSTLYVIAGLPVWSLSVTGQGGLPGLTMIKTLLYSHDD